MKYFSAEVVARSLDFGSHTSTSNGETTKNRTAPVSKRIGVFQCKSLFLCESQV